MKCPDYKNPKVKELERDTLLGEEAITELWLGTQTPEFTKWNGKKVNSFDDVSIDENLNLVNQVGQKINIFKLIKKINEDYYRGNRNRDRVIRQLNEQKISLDPSEHIYTRIVNGLPVQVSLSVNEKIDRFKKKLFGKSYIARTTLAAMRGTVIHSHINLILDDIINKRTVSFIDNNKKIISELRKRPEFNDATDDFMELDAVKYTILRKYVQGLVSEIQNKDKNAIIRTEQIVYDPIKDVAGSVDMLVLYSDGSVGIYDFKSMRFSYKSNELGLIKQISRKQKEHWGLQLTEYAKILCQSYNIPATKIREVRNLPIELSYNNIESGKAYNTQITSIIVNQPHLAPVPAVIERTGKESLDKVLERLYDHLEVINKKLTTEPKNEYLRRRVDKIHNTITKLQLTNEADYFIQDTNEMINTVLKNLDITDTSDENYMGIEDVGKYLEYFEVVANLSTDLKKQISDEMPDSEKAEAEKLNNIIDTINGSIENVRTLLLNRGIILLDNKFEVSLNSAITKKGDLNRFSQLSNLQGAPFEILYQMATTIQEEAFNGKREVMKRVEVVHDNLMKWLKQSGTSIDTLMGILVNPQTGHFNNKYAEGVLRKLKDAQESKDLDWLKKNTTFDRKWYEKEKEKQFKIFEEVYSDDAALEETQKQEWEAKYDIEKDEDAYYNKFNKYLKPVDSSVSYSEMWNYLLAHPVVMKYYQEIHDIIQESMFMMDLQYDSHFIPEMRKRLYEQIGRKGISGLFTYQYWKEFKHSLIVLDNDDTYGVVGPNGEIQDSIPKLFSNDLTEPLTDKEIKNLNSKLISEGFKENTKAYKDEFNKRKYAQERLKGVKLKSFDLSLIAVNFAEAAYMYKSRKLMEDYTNVLKLLVHDKKALNEFEESRYGTVFRRGLNNEIAKREGLTSGTINLFDTLIKQKLYGQSLQSKDWKVKIPRTNTKISFSKVILKLLRWATMRALSGNMGSIFQNSLGNMVIAHSLANDLDYNRKGKIKAEKMAFTERKKYVAICKMLGLDMRYERNRLTKLSYNSTLRKGLDDNNLMLGQELTLSYMQNTVALAVLDHNSLFNGQIKDIYKFEHPDLQKSLLDQIEFETNSKGELVAKIPGISPEGLKQLKNKIRKIVSQITGEVTDADKSVASTNIFMHLVMTFRRWGPILGSALFRTTTYDRALDRHDMGAMLAVFQELGVSLENFRKEMFPLLKEFIDITGNTSKKRGYNLERATYYMNKFNERTEDPSARITDVNYYIKIRKAKIKAGLHQMRMITLFMLITMLLHGDWDDDGKENLSDTFAGRKIRDLILRGYMELSFWTSPSAVNQMLGNTIPLASSIGDLWNNMTNTFDELRDAMFGENNRRDKTPFGYYTVKNIPLINYMANFMEFWKKYDNILFEDKPKRHNYGKRSHHTSHR